MTTELEQQLAEALAASELGVVRGTARYTAWATARQYSCCRVCGGLVPAGCTHHPECLAEEQARRDEAWAAELDRILP